MTYGLTPDGFKAKRLVDIKGEIEETLKLIFGKGIDLSEKSVFGQFTGVFAERESLLWELSEGIYNSQYPKTSFNTQLDHTVSLTGITRQPGIKSKVDLTFLGDVGTIIPAGSIFSVLGNSLAKFTLKQDAIIAAGVNEVQKITFSEIPDAGNFKLTYGTSESVALAFDSISQDIENALNGLPELSTVSVSGDFSVGFVITFEVDDGLKNHSQVTVTSNTLTKTAVAVTTTEITISEGYPNRVISQVEAEDYGPLAAPSGSLTVIENPLTGLDSVTNSLDATLGREIESDPELKIRREESLQRAGASVLGAIISALADVNGVVAVVGFENITFLTLDGRPPKSFEMIVQGGTDEDIANTIWGTKPAGIEYFGSETVPIEDSQGFTRNIKFSRPTEVDIYVEIDLTTNSDFPADGLDQVKEAVILYGDALGIGKDVIVYPSLVCALNVVNGITDLTIRIGKTAAPITDDNIIIAPQEISAWDSSRTIVTEV